MENKTYLCIDLKSFYASVECVERGLDPLTTNLVVADPSRTQKTICLAVSPSLKAYGIPGRARLFEVIQKVKEANRKRRFQNHGKPFTGKTYDDQKLKENPNLEIDYLIAPPRMSYYMKYSTRIYNIYLKYIAPEDIYPYSIDEVFCDITNYLRYYQCSALELATKMIHDVYDTCHITATAGIGTNLYLCKIAMDIVAKHVEPNEKGVRIAELDEKSYRKLLWSHRPITHFWRVGKGYAKKLEEHGMYTMGDVARCSIENEELLYDLFGVNAELLIDHAWGWEPCTLQSIKNFKPSSNSLGAGQVLHCAYEYEKAKLVIREMADNLALSLVSKNLVTSQLVLTVGYDIENLTDPKRSIQYQGEIVIDQYGRNIPKPAHGTINLKQKTASSKIIREATTTLFERIVNENLLIKRLNLTANNVVEESTSPKETQYEQMDLFTDYKEVAKEKEREAKEAQEDKKLQSTLLNIKEKYGKNAILKGMNLEEGSTARDRNSQIGGHKE